MKVGPRNKFEEFKVMCQSLIDPSNFQSEELDLKNLKRKRIINKTKVVKLIPNQNRSD